MNRPQGFMPQSAAKKKVNELRDIIIAGPVKTYRLNPDGTRGELIGTEKTTEFKPRFQRRYNYTKEK